MSEPLVPREDVRATLEARRELGAELEPELIEAFVARIERRLEERQRTLPRQRGSDTGAVILGVCSLALAIPLIAIPASLLEGFSGAIGILAVCAFLFLVNVIYLQRPR